MVACAALSGGEVTAAMVANSFTAFLDALVPDSA